MTGLPPAIGRLMVTGDRPRRWGDEGVEVDPLRSGLSPAADGCQQRGSTGRLPTRWYGKVVRTYVRLRLIERRQLSVGAGLAV
jgi:hypothetical protein